MVSCLVMQLQFLQDIEFKPDMRQSTVVSFVRRCKNSTGNFNHTAIETSKLIANKSLVCKHHRSIYLSHYKSRLSSSCSVYKHTLLHNVQSTFESTKRRHYIKSPNTCIRHAHLHMLHMQSTCLFIITQAYCSTNSNRLCSINQN